MNPLYKCDELLHQLKASSSKAYIYHEDFRFEAESAALKYGNCEHMIMMGSGEKNTFADAASNNDSNIVDFEKLRTSSLLDKSQLETISVTPKDTLLLPFSSGTTGLPKGVVLTHENVCVNLLQIALVS